MIEKVLVEHAQDTSMEKIIFHPNQLHIIIKWKDGKQTTYKYEFMREE